MYAFYTYVKHFSFFLLISILLYIIGQLFLAYFFPQLKKQKPYLKLFASLAVGFFLTAALYAFFKTGLISISILSFLLLLFMLTETYMFSKKNFDFSLKKLQIEIPHYKTLITLLVISVLVFSYEALLLLQNKSFPYAIPFVDMISRADLIEGLRRFGNEGRASRFIIYDDAFMGTTLYHYPKSWFSALTSSVFNIPAIVSLLLISHPILILIYTLGILSLFELFSKLRYYHYILSILILFCGGLYWPIYNEWPFLSVNFIGDSFPLSFLGRKLLSIYIVLAGVIHLIYSKQYGLSLILLWFLIPLYSTTIVGVTGATFIIIGTYTILSYLKIKKVSIEINLFRFFIYFVILMLALVLFNYFTAAKVDTLSVKNTVAKASIFQQFSIRTFIILFIETWVRLFAYYWPYILIFLSALFFTKWKAKRDITPYFFYLLLFVGLSVSGLMFSIYHHPKMNHWQAFYNITMPFIGISIVLFLISLHNKIGKPLLKTLLIIVFASFCAYQFYGTLNFSLKFKYNKAVEFQHKEEYSDVYVAKLNKLFEHELLEKGGIQLTGTSNILKGYNDYIAQFLSFNNKFLTPLNLTPYTQITENELENNKRLKNHPFTIFIRKKNILESSYSINEEMLNFILHYDFIAYMVVAKDVQIYPPLEAMFELYALDDLSGERFYVRINE